MGKVNVEWMNECPGLVPKNYGLLFGEGPAHPNLVTIGDEDETTGHRLSWKGLVWFVRDKDDHWRK